MLATSWSNKGLAYVFIGSLLIFSILRWDVDAWLDAKLNRMLMGNHIPLHYQSLDVSMGTVQLAQVVVQLPNIPQKLFVDTVQLSMNWNALWHGDFALNMKLENPFLQWQSVLAMRGQTLIFQKIDARVNIKKTQAWLGRNTLFQVEGDLTVHGNFVLKKKNGAPLSVSLKLLWNNAMVHALHHDYLLGDYQLDLNKGIWNVNGGEQLQISGEGSVNMSTESLLQWPLQGSLELHSPSNSKVGSLLPSNPLHINITGMLGSPRW